MKNNNNSKLSLIFATVGLLITCINLIISKFEGTSIILFICLITIWICSLEDYKKNNNSKNNNKGK